MANFQPAPTFADPVLIDEKTGKSRFNPIWLKWFLDLANAFGTVVTLGGIQTWTALQTFNAGTANTGQPASLAYNSVTDTDVTGDGTLYTIICDTEVYDQVNDYDATTGIFTAPRVGRYLCTGAVRLLQLGALHTEVQLFLVASNRSVLLFEGNPGAMRSASNILTIGSASYIDMDAGDTVKLQLSVSGSTKTVDAGDTYTIFGVGLVF